MKSIEFFMRCQKRIIFFSDLKKKETLNVT